jgi:hypothetical protein
MDTKGHEKFKPKFRLSNNFAGRNVQNMKLVGLLCPSSANEQAKI